MPHKNSLPAELKKTISRLGEQIKIARKRRSITMKDMASRMYVTRKTLARLENGEPGVSLAVLALALWILGLEKELGKIALPENDRVGIFWEHQKLPIRVRHSIDNSDELDF